jgi:cobalt/nickel transport system permease protein
MYEELLEDIAQQNRMREVNTCTKLTAGVGAILLCLLSASFVAPLFIGLVLTLTLLFLARVDPAIYGKVFFGPLLFAGLGVGAIVLLAGGEGTFWSWQPLPWFSLSVTQASINQGIFVFSRVFGGTSALLFIAFTTPMTDLFLVMRRARLPEEVLDLAMIIYRTIFLIMDQLVQVYQAQLMRLGYHSFRESIRSFATLAGSVFIASWEAGEDLTRAMEARCYEGKFAVLGEGRPVCLTSAAAVVSFLAVSAWVVAATSHIRLV